MPIESQTRNIQEAMSFEFLEFLRQKNPSWRFLSAQHASFVASFLYRSFISENIREVSEQELLAHLDGYIYLLNAGREEALFPRVAKDYLNEWADDEHGWLRKFYPTGKDEPYYDITPSAQKAIEWLAELRPQSYIGFIGTESRLITVFDILQQIVEGTELDPEQRIAILEKQKQEIEKEIELARTGNFTVFDKTQIRERFSQAITIAREILGDFRAVEQNFRSLDRDMREKISVWSKGKGELLEKIFEDQDGITYSEQGKSFAAFWKFLMSPSSQENFQNNLDQVLQMEAVREMQIPHNIRDIHHDWINAGAYVQDTVAQLNGQLRRYVDENYLEEERRILKLVREIESKALSLRNDPINNWDVALDAVKPELFMPLDRPLWSPQEKPMIQDMQIEEENEDISLDALYAQIYVDKTKLHERIDRMLQTRESTTLSEIVTQHPIEQGLSELMTYLTISIESRACFVSDIADSPDVPAKYMWTDENGRKRIARMPEVIFCRETTERRTTHG